jgi:hypothetical protein
VQWTALLILTTTGTTLSIIYEEAGIAFSVTLLTGIVGLKVGRLSGWTGENLLLDVWCAVNVLILLGVFVHFSSGDCADHVTY